ncbi:DNA polymerase III subunit beta [Kouleothrix aurantiaca]|uniref:Beta sliding clamp n=1 Tax=Kouleothrix aurantiaca TaxID=186479 RepID=A0A0P9FNW5_9CHLR|nr:DNA polymerase III subunit beta [Kouleothrix aurantiaca]
MKLACLQENLKRGLGIVSHAVAGKSTLPVLSNILIATDDGRLKLAATNLEIGITCWIGAKIEDEGAVTIPAKLLSDVVGGLPNDKITLQLDARTQTMGLTCARNESSIKGIEADEFPVIPKIDTTDVVTSFPPALLREIIDQVAFAAATDDTRPVLAGVLMRLRGKTAMFAAADGFRLAFRTVELPEPVAEPVEVIIPARALLELSRILGDTESNVEITVTPNGGQVLFHTEQAELVSRLIEGRFPEVERIIPTSYHTRTVLETQDLAKAVKLASYFANASSNIVRLAVEFSDGPTNGKVVISANAAEVGDNKGELDGMVDGEGGQIALNVKFLAEAIASVGTPQIAIEMQTAQNPGVFKPIGADGYMHIVMPMTVR